MKMAYGKTLMGTLATCLMWFAPQSYGQFTIDKRITIQPIQVRSTDGTTSVSNPSLTLFEAETDKIYSQAGIDIQFLPFITYDNSSFLNLSSNIGSNTSLYALRQSGAGGGAPSAESWSLPGQNGTLAGTIVRMFFVQQIDGSSSNLGFTLQSTVTAGVGGVATINQNVFMAIADNAITINRLDIVAHELGHALALDHATLGAGGTLNLMSSPRTSPASFNDIYPTGALADQLTGAITSGNPDWLTEQIDRARIMTISQSITPYTYNAIPEPATTTAIVGSIMLVIVAVYRRQRKARPTNLAV